MNWLPKPSAFDYAEQQVARRREMTKSFIAQQESTAAMLGSIGTVNSQSAVELAINNAVERILDKKA